MLQDAMLPSSGLLSLLAVTMGLLSSPMDKLQCLVYLGIIRYELLAGVHLACGFVVPYSALLSFCDGLTEQPGSLNELPS